MWRFWHLSFATGQRLFFGVRNLFRQNAKKIKIGNIPFLKWEKNRQISFLFFFFFVEFGSHF